MTTAGLESREILVNTWVSIWRSLKSFFQMNQSPRGISAKNPVLVQAFSRKRKKDTKKVKFGKEAKDHQQTSCGCYKVIGESYNPAWKTRNTSDYCFKKYYRKRVASSRNFGEQEKKNTIKATRLVVYLEIQLKGRLKGVMMGQVVQTSLTDCWP